MIGGRLVAIDLNRDVFDEGAQPFMPPNPGANNLRLLAMR